MVRITSQILYVTLQKAMHCCLKSTSLFYETLVADLLETELVLNSYDAFAANIIIKINE